MIFARNKGLLVIFLYFSLSASCLRNRKKKVRVLFLEELAKFGYLSFWKVTSQFSNLLHSVHPNPHSRSDALSEQPLIAVGVAPEEG